MRSELLIGDVAFGAALAFLFGVFAVSLVWNISATLIISLFCLAGSIVYRRYLWKEFTLIFTALIAGIFYFHLYFAWKVAHTILPLDSPLTFSAIVSDEPLASEKYLILTTNTLPPMRGTVDILAPPGSDIQYGDRIRIFGTIEKPDTPTDDPIVFLPKTITVIEEHQGFFLREWMIDLKLAILNNFRDLLPSDQAAFLGGILFGSKRGISDDLKQALSLTGTTHLVAVSGYKVTIVIVLAAELFMAFFPRRTALVFAIFFLLLFILMVGFEASAIRAAIMGLIALAARETGEALNVRNAIAFTAFFMVLEDPAVLTGDLSFMISFLAVIGIVYLGPPFKALFRYSEEGLFGWKEAGITTLSAQLATMPVLMNAFGQFSLIAIPANVLTLSLLPITMFFGFVLGVLGLISHGLAFFVGTITSVVVGYELWIIHVCAGVAVPLPLPLGSQFAIALYYLILVLFVFSYNSNERASRLA